jgi:C-terminal processing protease CtpA/Prc
MKKNFLSIILSFLTVCACCQNNSIPIEFNFGFEKTTPNQKLPNGWFQWGTNYLLEIDTTIAHSGNKSILIQPSDKRTTSSFGCIACLIPARYEGQEIELKAYMKLQDVSDGPIGLLLRIDGSSGNLSFDNMQQRNIMGSKDWTSYSVKLPYPEGAKAIYIGALLSGNGRLWVDDFEVLIDGVTIEKVNQVQVKEYNADLDKEFDKESGIDPFNPNVQNVKDLKLLGLIWGFLKYYHPNIAEGNYNWDYELFRIIPKIINATTTEIRDKIFVTWIKNLGDFETNKESGILNTEAKLYPDLRWISGSDLSNDLKTLLEGIKNAKRKENSYYIGLAPNVGNPEFKNERPYSSMRFPDTGYRILSLFRYWNIIQYYFPYKYLIDGEWENELDEYIPRFIAAANETEYKLLVLELIAQVHDTHANIWNKDDTFNRYFGLNYAPYKITFIENKPIITDFLKGQLDLKYDLHKGDQITDINNIPIDKIIAERLKITPASNLPTQLRTMAGDLLRTNDSALQIKFIRNGINKSIEIKTYSPKDLDIYQRTLNQDTCFKLIQPDIGYLYLGTIKNKYLPEIMKEIQNTKGLIIDLRCYPSEFVVFSLSKFLLPKSIPFVKFTHGSITSPGLFTMGSPLSVGEFNGQYYKGKIVILVNEVTLSQAEYTTMALRVAPRAIVLGSTTSGADGNVSQITLPGGINTLISGIGVYYPDGGETQRVGIIPDVEVSPSINGILKNQDELLNKAIEIIMK